MLIEKPKYVLEDALGFETDDLEANMRGQITASQYRKLARDFMFWLVISALLTGFLIYNVRRVQSSSDNGVVGSALLLLFFGGLLDLFTINNAVRLALDLMSRKVQFIEGTIQLDIFKRSPSFRMSISETTFALDKAAFLAFKNNEPYIVYFLPYTRRILSAEWLRPHRKAQEDY